MISDWVDIKERSPEYFEDVLIYFMFFGKPKYMIARKRSDSEMMCDVFDSGSPWVIRSSDVIAWLSLNNLGKPNFGDHK